MNAVIRVRTPQGIAILTVDKSKRGYSSYIPQTMKTHQKAKMDAALEIYDLHSLQLGTNDVIQFEAPYLMERPFVQRFDKNGKPTLKVKFDIKNTIDSFHTKKHIVNVDSKSVKRFKTVKPTNTSHRPLYKIAQEIRKTWVKVNKKAIPYLDAMQTLQNMNSSYGHDSAENIVRDFLSNAGWFRGKDATSIKAELNLMVSGEIK